MRDQPLLLFYADIQSSLKGREHVATLKLCGLLDTVLGRRVLVSDLCDRNLMAFLQALECSGLTPETARRMRSALRAIWNLAVSQGHVTANPQTTKFLQNVATVGPPDERVPDGKTSLRQAAEDMFLVRPTIRNENTRSQYRSCIRRLGEFLGRAATVDDLHDDCVSAFMSELLTQYSSVNTVREKVNRLLSLWTWLAKRGVVRKFPTVIKPPEPDPLPQALTPEQLRRLFQSAGRERELLSGIPANLWWLSFLAFVWNTSERKSAALAVQLAWFDFDKQICTIPPQYRKGGRKWGIYELWPETIPLLQSCIAADPKRVAMWPWPKCKQAYYTAFDRILRDAQIPVTRKTKTHGLRCSHATWLKVAGGDPTAQLGHGDVATTTRHYLDPTQFRQKQPKLFVPWTATA